MLKFLSPKKRKTILEFDSSNQNSQLLSESNDPSTSFFFLAPSLMALELILRKLNHLSLLDQLPLFFRAKSSTDIGRFQSIAPIKIQTDPSKHLLRINQYPI